MADHFQLNLGSLRSTITLTLHTHHAARLWQGRLAREGSHPIMSMAAYINITNILKQAAAQDDPFADWFMLMLEDKVLRAKAQMGQLMEQVSHLEKLLPSQIDVGDNLNIHPVTLPLFIGSQLGFLAVYLLTDYDTLVRRVLLAHHTALIGRPDMEGWIDQGAHQVRSLFGIAHRCRVSGVTRRDVAADNARFQEAVDKYGRPPKDVLDGERRSQFAPPIIAVAGSTESEPASPSDDVPADDETDATDQPS
jgi:integrating conjugative element protein (TIGR03761 family)